MSMYDITSLAVLGSASAHCVDEDAAAAIIAAMSAVPTEVHGNGNGERVSVLCGGNVWSVTHCAVGGCTLM
jgi:hypothetical protein